MDLVTEKCEVQFQSVLSIPRENFAAVAVLRAEFRIADFISVDSEVWAIGEKFFYAGRAKCLH